jgi:hypothetical protein
MAVLYKQNPLASIFTYAPFDSQCFRTFAEESSAAIHAAEEAARLAFKNLLQHLIASMQGILATQNLAFECKRQQYQVEMRGMQTQLGDMKALLQVIAGSKRTKTQGTFKDYFEILCTVSCA